MLGSQRGHGVLWQVCLAHLPRDAKYAIDAGDPAFGAPFRQLLLRAVAIGQRRETMRDTTLTQYLYDPDRIISMPRPGRRVERHLRPSVIFRKVTSGFRRE
jgi:transposase